MNNIINLIYIYAQLLSFSPELALSVAETESNFNPNIVGKHGEIGLFQIRPQFSKFSRKELFKPENNVLEGIQKLKEAKQRCKHKLDIHFLVCYNVGITGGNRIKHPSNFPYVKKVKKKMRFYANKSRIENDRSFNKPGVYGENFSRYYF